MQQLREVFTPHLARLCEVRHKTKAGNLPKDNTEMALRASMVMMMKTST
jgi:hypothetical protein